MEKKSTVLWKPNPGPQTEFMTASEFEVLYGGAAGGGKSDALLMGGLRYIDRPSYNAIFLKKTYPELMEMIDRSMVFKKMGGVWNEQKKRWKFPSGATYGFGYFEKWKDHTRYQGQQYQYVAWDEIGSVDKEKFWSFMMSRCRTTDPDITTMMRCTANPGGSGHAWLKKRFIDPCGNDGEEIVTDPRTGLKRRFIPARLKDNPHLDLNDPGYRKQLESLPEILRRQLLEGDWSAATGLALDELRRYTHVVDPYEVPDHWNCFGAFDWGYAHPGCFGFFAVAPDRKVVLVDSLHFYRKSPIEIVERIQEKLHELGKNGRPMDLRYTVAGHDVFARHKARGDFGPTIAEEFMRSGLPLMKANISRVQGLNNLRQYISVRGPEGSKREPLFTMMRTVGNERVFDTLESMVVDPRDYEDALKTDADEYGEGGDDAYDMVRYGLASRPAVPMDLDKRKKRDPRNYDTEWDNFVKSHPAQTQRTGGNRAPWNM